MPRGRPPKPVELKRAQGNPGKRPLPEPVRVGPAAVPEPPADLPPEGLELWELVVPELAAVGLARSVDRPALTRMCVHYARAERARQVVAREGYFALGSTGQLVEHPALGIERAESALFLRYAEQYALTGLARTRAGLAELQRRSLADELNERLERRQTSR